MKAYYLMIILMLPILVLSCASKMVSRHEASNESNFSVRESIVKQKTTDISDFQKNQAAMILALKKSSDSISQFSEHYFAHWLEEFDRENRLSRENMHLDDRVGYTVLRNEGDDYYFIETAVNTAITEKSLPIVPTPYFTTEFGMMKVYLPIGIEKKEFMEKLSAPFSYYRFKND